jgi:catechol 2,3-dioxygenase-like lactoylglutathione lyase family enzyme
MPGEMTIPCLPCASLSDTLAFYAAMGFEITYQQTRPSSYGCVQRGGIDLHFFGMKNVDPSQSYSTCIVLVENADELHAAFTAGLRQHVGKVPSAGIPRITKPNNNNVAGDRRFNVIDPSGNWIRFIQKAASTPVPDNSDVHLTKAARQLYAAALLLDSKGDPAGAAKLLDSLLAADDDALTAVERVQALVLRADAALNLGDEASAQKLLLDLGHITLSEQERALAAEYLQRAEGIL